MGAAQSRTLERQLRDFAAVAAEPELVAFSSKLVIAIEAFVALHPLA